MSSEGGCGARAAALSLILLSQTTEGGRQSSRRGNVYGSERSDSPRGGANARRADHGISVDANKYVLMRS